MKADSRPKIGVLALQGDFEAHCKTLEQAGARALEVRTAADLSGVDGLILPGGESTTMLKLLDIEGLFEPLLEFGRHYPIFGTCAGAILLATDVLHPCQRSLALVDITVERNGYGRQVDSRIVEIEVEGQRTEAVFIRAPIIRRAGPQVRVLATYLEQPVLAEQGHHMVATFHPELGIKHDGGGGLLHRRFVERVTQLRSGPAISSYTM